MRPPVDCRLRQVAFRSRDRRCGQPDAIRRDSPALPLAPVRGACGIRCLRCGCRGRSGRIPARRPEFGLQRHRRGHTRLKQFLLETATQKTRPPALRAGGLFPPQLRFTSLGGRQKEDASPTRSAVMNIARRASGVKRGPVGLGAQPARARTGRAAVRRRPPAGPVCASPKGRPTARAAPERASGKGRKGRAREGAEGRGRLARKGKGLPQRAGEREREAG